MRRQAVALRGLVLSVALAGVGCAVDNTPPEGDLEFDWTFTGEDCGMVGVATVGIQIFDVNGNVITNDSVACSQESVTYTDFVTGSYSFTLTGFSPDGSALYTASGPITVNSGSNSYSVDLSLEQ